MKFFSEHWVIQRNSGRKEHCEEVTGKSLRLSALMKCSFRNFYFKMKSAFQRIQITKT